MIKTTNFLRFSSQKYLVNGFISEIYGQGPLYTLKTNSGATILRFY